MGLAYIEGTVKAPGRRRRGRRIRFLVDSGAVYSVLPRVEWKALGLKPERELEFVLADGTTLTRGVSECSFELEGRRATSPVVLGDTEDQALLGAVTLETLGLMLNPLNLTLQPMRMVLARSTRPHGRIPTGAIIAAPDPLRGTSSRLTYVGRAGALLRAISVSRPAAAPRAGEAAAGRDHPSPDPRRVRGLAHSLPQPGGPVEHDRDR